MHLFAPPPGAGFLWVPASQDHQEPLRTAATPASFYCEIAVASSGKQKFYILAKLA